MFTRIKSTVDIDFRDIFQRSPLHYAVRLGHFSESLTLLQKGADVNAIDVFGNTPLSLACVDKPSIAILKLLLKYNVDINLERPNNMDLLLECVLNCRTPLQTTIIRTLVEHGKNINSTDRLSNRSCMHLVAMTGYIPLVKLFLKMGAIVNIKDNFDCTPMKMAKIHQNVEALSAMQTYIDKNRLI